MIVTVLAIVCIALLGFLTVLGYRAIIRGGEPGSPAGEMEKCTVCRRSIGKEQMVERQIGDYRILHFCPQCITGLSTDLGAIGDPGLPPTAGGPMNPPSGS